MSREHTVNASQIHHDWDARREPVVAVESGDIVHFDLPITGEGQVTESSTVTDVVWDFDTIYNLAGAVHVAGASRGDTLEIEILELTPGPWGWTTFIPGLRSSRRRFPGAVPEDLRPPRRIHRDGCARCRGAASSHFSGRWECRRTWPGRSRRSLHTEAGGTSTAGIWSRARLCGCRSGARARSSPAGMPTRRRATARSASAPSSARWRQPSVCTCASAASPGPPSSAPRGRISGPVLRDDGDRRRSDGGGTHGGSQHDHVARRGARNEPRGRVRALQPRRQS